MNIIKFLSVTGIEGARVLINIADIMAIEEEHNRTVFHMHDDNLIYVKESYGMIKEKLSDYVC